MNSNGLGKLGESIVSGIVILMVVLLIPLFILGGMYFAAIVLGAYCLVAVSSLLLYTAGRIGSLWNSARNYLR